MWKWREAWIIGNGMENVGMRRGFVVQWDDGSTWSEDDMV